MFSFYTLKQTSCLYFIPWGKLLVFYFIPWSKLLVFILYLEANFLFLFYTLKQTSCFFILYLEANFLFLFYTLKQTSCLYFIPWGKLLVFILYLKANLLSQFLQECVLVFSWVCRCALKQQIVKVLKKLLNICLFKIAIP